MSATPPDFEQSSAGGAPSAARADDGGSQPYLKLPWWLVTAGLLAVLLVALGAGLYANRVLRPEAVPPTTSTPPGLAAPPPTQATPAPAATTPIAAAVGPPTATPL